MTGINLSKIGYWHVKESVPNEPHFSGVWEKTEESNVPVWASREEWEAQKEPIVQVTDSGFVRNEVPE